MVATNTGAIRSNKLDIHTAIIITPTTEYLVEKMGKSKKNIRCVTI